MKKVIEIWSSIILWFKNMFSKQTKEQVVKIEESVKQPVKKETAFTREFKILTKRPENMSFDNYRRHLKAQKPWLTARKKGFLVYLSSVLISNKVDATLRKKTYHPFVGSVKHDLLKAI